MKTSTKTLTMTAKRLIQLAYMSGRFRVTDTPTDSHFPDYADIVSYQNSGCGKQRWRVFYFDGWCQDMQADAGVRKAVRPRTVACALRLLEGQAPQNTR